ncbi:MAG TPA: hypothetical protein PK347_00755 [Burkholderiaceae bacterium]|nr:hypothetical protein [Burkholderiaceae bacterium]
MPGGLTGVPALAGRLRVVPAAPLSEALQSSRRDWAARLAVGQPADRFPGLMGSVFNLCSQAHRVCAQLAVHAALPHLPGPLDEVAQRLCAETAQEHIRRMGLDWPRLLSTADNAARMADAQLSLGRCPVLSAPGSLAAWEATQAWLEAEWLDLPAALWEARWQADGVAWLAEWASQRHGWLPTLLHAARGADVPCGVDANSALPVPVDDDSMQVWAAALHGDRGFALAPSWQGRCAHTGNWTRLNGCRPVGALTPWGLLGSRLSELIRLVWHGKGHLSDEPTLAYGSCQTGERCGLAWVEMARGLLVHQVSFQSGPGEDKVETCQVVAPTEWNFHPHGVVAQFIAGLDGGLPAAMLDAQARLLMAAFDPCVPFDIATPHVPVEVEHA